MAFLWLADESSGWAAARLELGMYAIDPHARPLVLRAAATGAASHQATRPLSPALSRRTGEGAPAPAGVGEGDAQRLMSAEQSENNQVSPQARLIGNRTPGGQERWALCCPPNGIRVNGDPVWLGLRILKDHDELRLETGERLFFSTERLAEIVPFPGGPRPVHCPRCHKLIEPGQLAVLCPGCQTWHHQTTDLPCWTYDERCALCPQSTALDAGLIWTPEQAQA